MARLRSPAGEVQKHQQQQQQQHEASGSKRKRGPDASSNVKVNVTGNGTENEHDSNSGLVDVSDRDVHTPKRSRVTNWRGSSLAATTTATATANANTNAAGDKEGVQNSVRRKRAKFGLSSLNKRHAAASRFQEGSMSDKPSVQPPTLFMHETSSHSLAGSAYSANVDHLMDQYHDGDTQEAMDTVDAAEQQHHEHHEHHQHQREPELKHKDSTSGLFRFGRMVASSFNPANIFSGFARSYEKTKEEMTVRNIEENRRKAAAAAAALKADAERRYAEMKETGQFAFTPVGRHAEPRDSTVSHDASKALPHLPHHVAGEAAGQRQHSPVQQTTPELGTGTGMGSFRLKSRKSFFSVMRHPSLSSLKRVGSDINIPAFAAHQSAPSVSPEKQDDTPMHSLPRAHSRRDLNKQQKLSKRVSDLEAKLADARRELNSAITHASPLPPLPSTLEKYTPPSKYKHMFVPGKLPSLPSERLLFPPSPVPVPAPVPAPASPPSANVAEQGLQSDLFASDQNTKHKSQGALHPQRLSPIDLTSVSEPASEMEIERNGDEDTEQQLLSHRLLSPFQGPEQLDAPDADLESISGNTDVQPSLGASDPRVEGIKNSSIRKRKCSGSPEDDSGTYKPSSDSDDDYVEARRTKSKKRKSRGSIDAAATVPKKATGDGDSTAQSQSEEASSIETSTNAVATTNSITVYSADVRPGRSSIDSQVPLDPIYEEESTEPTTSVAAKHDSLFAVDGDIHAALEAKQQRTTTRNSSSSTANAKHSRARSRSPAKHLGLRSRCASNPATSRDPYPGALAPPEHAGEMRESIVVSTTPGEHGVPEMPGHGVRDKEVFEWPEDVF